MSNTKARNSRLESVMQYLAKTEFVQKRTFKTIFLVVIAAVYATMVGLLVTGVMTAGQGYESLAEAFHMSEEHTQAIIISIQVFEPYLTLMMILLLIKGKRSFYWWGTAGGTMLMVSQIIVGLWMGVIKGAIFIAMNTITYLKWGSQPEGPLVVKKADSKVWIMIISAIALITILPGWGFNNISSDSIFYVESAAMSYVDSLSFALAVSQLALNNSKYREARLLQVLGQFATPAIFIMSGQYIYAAAGILFLPATLSGLASWYIKARKPEEAQRKEVLNLQQS